MSTRSGLQANLTQTKTELEGLQSDYNQLLEQVEAQETELTELRTLRDKLAETVTRLEGEAQTVSQGVADQLAQLGVASQELPVLEPGDEVESFESLQAQIDATEDPIQRGVLAKKQAELMGL